MASDPAQEPDRIAEAPHPRETPRVFGQGAAMGEIIEAIVADRVHHAWLFTGPQGVGKASLAWAMARQLIARPLPDPGGGLFGDPLPAAPVAADLTLDPEHPVARQIAALSSPNLALVRRPWDERSGKLRAEITVEEIRRLKAGFAMASDSARRVAIIDAADELNQSAANALLKLLEEPPANVVLILISHRPARLLPTIRSRCRSLRCVPLAPDDMARALNQAEIELPQSEAALARLTRLSGGSVGRAIGLLLLDGLDLYAALLALLASLPDHDRPQTLALAQSLASPDAAPRRALAFELLQELIGDLARLGVTGALPEDIPPEARAALARLCPDPRAAQAWAAAAPEIAGRLAHGTAVNLDPQSLILDMVATLGATASRARSQTGAL